MPDASISIIIPAYNVDKYLEAALDSIKLQEELPDEVILIDDGSTDYTLEVAENFSFPIPYKVISIKNGGQGNARNIGVNIASSKYVYFFDADDLLAQPFIKSLKKQIRGNRYPDIVLFAGESFNDHEYRGSRRVDYSRGFSGFFDCRSELLDKGFSHSALFCSCCCYVSKKALWGPQGLAFGHNFLEDEAIFYPVLFACSSFLVIDEVFFLRRNREGSTMTVAPHAKHVNGALDCLQTTLQLFATAGLTYRERWHVSKLLKHHCIVYMQVARAANMKCSYKHVLSAIKATRDMSLLFVTCLIVVRLDTFQTVRDIGRALRKLKLCLRGG